MKARTDQDIENLIKNSVFPNPGHKRKLRERLFEPTTELSLDELDAAAGGAAIPEPEARLPRSSFGEQQK